MKTPEMPNGKSIKQEGLDTAALVAGVTLSKVAQGFIKKNGIFPSIVLLAAGFFVTANAPKANDTYHVKAIGRGVQAYGALTLISEISKDTIDLGLGGLMGTTPMTNPIPASIRAYIKDNVPVLTGVQLKLNGVAASDYVNNRAQAPAVAAHINLFPSVKA